MVSIYLRLNFSGGLRKTISFLQNWRFSRSRSSKVIDFGTNQKRVCDFLLVRNSNLGPILHHFGDMAAFMCSWPRPDSTLILGVFLLHQIAHFGVRVSIFGREIIFEVFHANCAKKNIPQRHGQTDGQTDRQTTCNLITALCMRSIAPVVERGKNWPTFGKVTERKQWGLDFLRTVGTRCIT